jgi:ATP-dependent protease ClpP protease subunit
MDDNCLYYFLLNEKYLNCIMWVVAGIALNIIIKQIINNKAKIENNHYIENSENSENDEDSLNPCIALLQTIEDLEKTRNSNILFIVDNFWEKVKLTNKMKKYIIDIDNDDVFLKMVNLRKYDNFDIILHSSGGNACSSEMIATTLINYKNEESENCYVKTHVPEYAMSAGTLIALSGDLHMNKYAYLGPTDPQICYTVGGEETQYPAKIIKDVFIKYKNVIEMTFDDYSKGLEAKMDYDDNIILVKNILKNNYKTSSKNIFNMFTRGDIPHHKPFSTMLLKKNNITVNKVDDDINELFNLFRIFREKFI